MDTSLKIVAEMRCTLMILTSMIMMMVMTLGIQMERTEVVTMIYVPIDLYTT